MFTKAAARGGYWQVKAGPSQDTNIELVEEKRWAAPERSTALLNTHS